MKTGAASRSRAPNAARGRDGRTWTTVGPSWATTSASGSTACSSRSATCRKTGWKASRKPVMGAKCREAYLDPHPDPPPAIEQLGDRALLQCPAVSWRPAGEIDPRADFAAVYEAHYPAVYRAVRGVVLDPDVAEDVTQDAFVKAFRARHRYQPTGRVEAWLCTIAVREAISRLRWAAVQRR